MNQCRRLCHVMVFTLPLMEHVHGHGHKRHSNSYNSSSPLFLLKLFNSVTVYQLHANHAQTTLRKWTGRTLNAAKLLSAAMKCENKTNADKKKKLNAVQVIGDYCDVIWRKKKRKKKTQSLSTLPAYDKNNYRPKDETSTCILSEDIKNQYQLFSWLILLFSFHSSFHTLFVSHTLHRTTYT